MAQKGDVGLLHFGNDGGAPCYSSFAVPVDSSANWPGAIAVPAGSGALGVSFTA